MAPLFRRLSGGHPAIRGRGGTPHDSRRDAGATLWVIQGEDKLQFEVNGQEYYLNFIEDERRWFVLVPTETGLQRIPVYIDGSKYERIGASEKNRQNRPN
jgi:hypothetical protein